MSRIFTTTARGLLALAFALLIALAGPLAAATHEPHAHSAAAPEAAQAAAQAELAPEAVGHGCCALPESDHAAPMAAGCQAGDHGSCCGDCPHCSKRTADHAEHAHGAMAAPAHAGHGDHAHGAMTGKPMGDGTAAAPAGGCCALAGADTKAAEKAADDCCQGGAAAACCAACDHCAKAEGGGCCGHGAVQMGEAKAAFACPMHPAVTAAEAGKCPECGMKLEATDGGKPQS